MSTNQGSQSPNPAAETPQPAAMLSPEQVVEEVSAVRTRIADVMPLTAKQKKALRGQRLPSSEVLQAQINVLVASDGTAQLLGQPSEEVRQLVDESNRWTAAETELRRTLDGVAGANLIRRQRIALITGQAYGIVAQLARDPAHADLVPHVREVKRLKSVKRRKKAQPAPTPQAPSHGVAPEHDVSVTQK
jgi:hypothetical protein